jgi:hypothetical protein
MARGAEILEAARALGAGAAGAGDSGHDAVPRRETLDAGADLDDLAARFVPHRHGEGDARVAPREELQIGPAGQSGANANHDLARRGGRPGHLALLEAADRGLDEGPHGG